MSRLGVLGLVVCLAVAVPSAGAALGARRSWPVVTVGPMRLVSPDFGYVVAQRTTQTPAFKTEIRVLVYDHGHWRDSTPQALRPPAFPRDQIDAVDDVDFVGSREGWLATFDCAAAGVHLYRTSDGGRSWHSLGEPTGHSCSAPATTFLSFVDASHGWMEPTSPTGPVGLLLETGDGGRSWKHVATGPSGSPGRSLPCLAPIRLVSSSTGWMGRCDEPRGGVFSSTDGGRRWTRTSIAAHDGRFDVPWFHGSDGVEAATAGTRPIGQNGRMRAVVFSVTTDGGRTWTTRATRPIASCPLSAYSTDLWPTSVANGRTWWIVSDGARPTTQVTVDGGRTWRTVASRGLPARPCSVITVSAAGSSAAWAVVRAGRSTALYRTADGGRDWRRVDLFPR